VDGQRAVGQLRGEIEATSEATERQRRVGCSDFVKKFSQQTMPSINLYPQEYPQADLNDGN
jgi:hypothetical protein